MENNNDRSNGLDRRRFVQAVGAVGVTTGVAGCFGDDDSDGTTVQMSMDSIDEEFEEEYQQALWDAGLSEDIEIDIVATSLDGRDDQYRQWLNADRAEPDVMMMDVGWSIPFIERGQLLPLDEHMSDEAIDELENDYFQASVQASVGSDGNMYGVPLFPDFGAMMYRKDLAEDAGYNPEEENWATEAMTWQRFSQITADVMDANPDMDHGYTFPFDLSQTITCCTFNEYMSQWGGAYFGGVDNLYGPVGDRPITVTDEEALNALRMIRTFIHGHDDEHSLDSDEFAGDITPDGVLDWRYTGDLESFLGGDAFAYRTWPTFLHDASDEDSFGDEMHDRVGLMPFPYAVSESESQYDGIGGTMTSLGGWNLSINPNSENIDAAVQVLEASMADDAYLLRWAEAGTLPPKPDVMESDVAAEDPVMGPYLDTLSVAGQTTIARPVTPVYFDQADAVAQEVHDVISQNKSPEEGMNDLEEALQSLEDES